MKNMINVAIAVAIAPCFLAPLSAAPTVAGPYKLTVFAAGTSAYNNPDSITTDPGGNVWVTYANGVAPDGSDGKSSTVIEYTFAGDMIAQYSILGSDDGLKYNPIDGTIWALRNQDGNAALTTIDPRTRAMLDYTFSTPSLHGGGYDDMVFNNGQIYLSASNPTLDPSGFNTAPSIVIANVAGSTIQTRPFLAGDVTAVDAVTRRPVRTIQTDPDSLRLDASGNLVLDSQADGILLFVIHFGAPNQRVVEVPLTDATGGQVMVDDTSFPNTPSGTLLFTDSKANKVYALTSHAFETGMGYTSTGSAIGIVDVETGLVTPVVTGIGSSHGSVFVPGPEEKESVFFDAAALDGRGAIVAENQPVLKVPVTRGGNDLSNPLRVRYTVGGSAQAGINYKTLSGTVVFPAGASRTTINVHPLDDRIKNGGETLKLKLQPAAGDAFSLGQPSKATIHIVNVD